MCVRGGEAKRFQGYKSTRNLHILLLHTLQILYQVTGVLPYAVDMVMETGLFSAAFSISGDKFTSELEKRRKNFDDQFEDTFGLDAKVCCSQAFLQ